METMSSPETIFEAKQPVRPLKRVEYDRLVRDGFFEDERVELLLGLVVPMSPTDPAHSESTYQVVEAIRKAIGARARVREQTQFAASDISEPQSDVMVTPNGPFWDDHASRAFLVVEVARSSLRKDKGPKAVIYGSANVDEYWIVNHIDEVVEVYRDRHDGEWRQRTTHQRGETIAMLAFPDVQIAVSEILPPVDSR